MQSKYLATVASASVGGTGAGTRLHGVVVGTGTATAVVTLYDGTSTAGDIIGVINAAASGYYDFHGRECSNGLFIDQTVAAAKVTVLYE